MSHSQPKISLFYEVARVVINWFFTTFYDFSTSGTRNVPLVESSILATNHVSFYDPPVISLYAHRQLSYFARDSLFKGFLGKCIRKLNAIPVARDSADIKSLKTIFKILNSKGAIVIFPEGTRSVDGKVAEPKPGTGMVVCKSKAIVVPVRIFGTFEVFSRHKKLPSLGGAIHVSYGQPIPAETIDPGKDHPERYLEVSRRILAAINKLEAPKYTII